MKITKTSIRNRIFMLLNVSIIISTMTCYLFQNQVFSQKTKIPEIRIKFPPSASELNFEQKFVIDQIYDKMPNGETLRLVVLSEAEEKNGNESCKINLSKSRCELVFNYLIEKGIEPNHIQYAIKPHGKQKKQNTTNVSYRDFVNQKGVYSVLVYKSSNNPYVFANGDGCVIDSSLMQEFKIDPCYGSSVRGNHNTSIYFPENAFYTDCSFSSCAEITVQLWEFFSYSEMIAAGLTTTSNGKILETGGMIYIRVLCNNKELKLRPDKMIRIVMPTRYNKNFELFNGKQNRGIVNWIPNSEEKVSNLAKNMVEENEEGVWTEEEELIGSLMQSSSLGWINLDLFYEEKDVQDIFVKVNAISEKTSVIMVFHDMKSILPGGIFNAQRVLKFSGIPRGKEVTIIAFQKDGNEMMAGYVNTTTGLNSKEEISMSRISEKEFKNFVEGLN
ncbi:MAG: hypothetical protein JXR58_02125 [Bacteroidales bacterium]|nr:hypothetical protein [Bacteroidales bacterium]